MSNLKAIIRGADYLYACRFSSYEATRYYLNGVFVDTVNKRLVATDGHRLGLLALDEDDAVFTKAASFILTNSKDLQRACKPVRGDTVWLRCYDDRIEIVATGNSGAAASDLDDWPSTRVIMQMPAASVYVDGTFPDYLRVIPREVSGSVVDGASTYSFNTAYVATFAADAKRAIVSLLPNGNGPALVFNADPRFMGVLMPTRGGKTLEDVKSRIADILGDANG